jgi:hypothetical protein
MEFTEYLRKEGRITVPREVGATLCIEKGNLVSAKSNNLGRSDDEHVE